MKGVVPVFNRLAHWLAIAVDWDFWHDFVHNRLIRDIFVGFADFLADVLDMQGVDGTGERRGQITPVVWPMHSIITNRLCPQLRFEYFPGGGYLLLIVLRF